MIEDINRKDSFPGWQIRLLGAILIRPYLWRTTLIQMWRLIPKRRSKSSFGDYMRMRTEISHGDPLAPTRAQDILEWLNWCRTQLRLR